MRPDVKRFRVRPATGYGVQRLGLKFGLKFGVEGLGFRVERLRDWSLGFRVLAASRPDLGV